MLLIAGPEAAQAEGREIVLVEPVRSPWARPSGVSRYRQQRIGRWRVTTWTDDSAGDRVVRLQRWEPGYTLIYERHYLPGGAEASDRAEAVVGHYAHGDPVTDRRLPAPATGAVRAALVERLSRCFVAPHGASRMLEGFERAYPRVVARGRAAEADAAADRTGGGRRN